ncbi:MAG: S8 family serine peptidase [Paenisporosarcina sp.]
MRILVLFSSAFAFFLISALITLGLVTAPVIATSSMVGGGTGTPLIPPGPRGKVPGQYIVVLKNETFAEVNEQFPDKEKVTASNIPEENAQVNPVMKAQYETEIEQIVNDTVEQFNGTDSEDYPTSPLGEQGGKVQDTFTHAIKGFSVTGVDDPSIFVGNENVSSVQQDDYKIPAAQYLPHAMNRGDSEKMANSLNIDNRESAPNVDIAILDARVVAGHPDLNVVESVNTLDSGWRAGDSRHGYGNAGVCCARDNLGGVVGSAPGAKIHSVWIFGVSANMKDTDGPSSTTSINVRALDWVAAHASTIEVANWNIQCLQSGETGCPLNSAENSAANSVVAAGVTLFTAAGNFDIDTDGFQQCGYTITICVGAYGDMDGLCGGKSSTTYSYSVHGRAEVGRDDRIAVFSNWGNEVDVAGPGYPSLSVAWPGDGSASLRSQYPYIGGFVQDGYQFYSGTSQANPTVSGIGLVIKAVNPSFTPAQVLSALLAEAVPVTEACDGSSKGGYVVTVPSQENAPLAYAGDY